MTGRSRAASAVQAEAKQDTKPEATPEATPDEATPETATDEATPETAEEDPWADLPDAEAVEYVRAGVPRVDVDKETPEFVKSRVIESYELYDSAYLKCMEEMGKPSDPSVAQIRKASDVANKASSRVQRFKTEQQAKDFVKLARRYTKFKGWTMKGDVDPKNPLTVAFRVKYPEIRERKEA